MPQTIAERFWAKVDKDGPVPEARPDLGPCWIWTAAKDRLGYGKFAPGSKTVLAHRFAYTLVVGLILKPDLDHLCRNPSCVNPRHLEPVTHRENLRRGLKGAFKTHCVNGHRLDETNTYTTPRGFSECRTCRREASARYEARGQRNQRRSPSGRNQIA